MGLSPTYLQRPTHFAIRVHQIEWFNSCMDTASKAQRFNWAVRKIWEESDAPLPRLGWQLKELIVEDVIDHPFKQLTLIIEWVD